MSTGTKTGGRAKDTPNKNMSFLKEAIIDAAKITGRDGNGKEGLTGYCCKLAQEEPKAFATLLGRVLPMQTARPAATTRRSRNAGVPGRPQQRTFGAKFRLSGSKRPTLKFLGAFAQENGRLEPGR